MRVTLAACAFAVIGVLGAGCSVGKHASSPVARAVAATTKAGTARFTIEETQNDNGQPSTIKGAGVLDRRIKASDVTFASEQVGTSAAPVPYEFEEIVKNGLLYFRDPDQPLPPGKSWLRLTPTEMASLSGPSPGTSSTGYDPNSFLDLMAGGIEGAPWKAIGPEMVDGVPAVRYHAKADLTAVLAKKDSELTKAQQQFKKSPLASSTFVYDVWVGASDKRVRKLAIHVTGGSAAARMSLTFGFSDYGARLAVNAPPGAKTIGAQALSGAQ